MREGLRNAVELSGVCRQTCLLKVDTWMSLSHATGVPGVHLLTLSSDVSTLELSPDAAGLAVLAREEFVVDIKGMHPLQVTCPLAATLYSYIHTELLISRHTRLFACLLWGWTSHIRDGFPGGKVTTLQTKPGLLSDAGCFLPAHVQLSSVGDSNLEFCHGMCNLCC